MAVITTFGELMLRLKTPGFQRFMQATSLDATFGGGEANVAVSLAQFGHQARFVSAMPSNPLGDWAIAELRKVGVDTSHILRQGDRLGVYFLEAGASQRASNVIYDRAGSSCALIRPGQVDWKAAFAQCGWYHVTGITPALSDSAREVCRESLVAARAAGAVVSFDLNFRKKLWTGARAGEVISALMPLVDVAIANEEDCEKVFGIKAAGSDMAAGALDHQRYLDVARQMTTRFPNLTHVAITLRESLSASNNRWSGLLVDRTGHSFSRRHDLTIIDRVGGGDSFAGGLIHALLTGRTRDQAIEFAAAASALKHSLMGDFNLISVAEVDALVAGDGSGRVQR
jgi:2-dehydro-3-deoxygluconokinase